MNEFLPVSILMSVFNSSECLGVSLNSLLSQTLTDFEIVILDDGSTDQTAAMLDEFSSRDYRIRVFRNSSNLGLAASLNRGVRLCRGKYIARMDADDACYPERLEMQYDYLEKNPRIDIVGSNAHLVTVNGELLSSTSMPLTHEAIERSIHRNCPLLHPTIMGRKEFFSQIGGYDEHLRKKQDYDLWLRGIDQFRFANIEKPLLRYTIADAKPIKTDLYGFYVRVLNGVRRGTIVKSTCWAILVLGANLLRKQGYVQKMHRKAK